MLVESDIESGGISHQAKCIVGWNGIKPERDVLLIVLGHQPDRIELKPAGRASVDELNHVSERFADRCVVEFDLREDDGMKPALKRLSFDQLLRDEGQLPARLCV